jgi:hypothetical protein
MTSNGMPHGKYIVDLVIQLGDGSSQHVHVGSFDFGNPEGRNYWS